MFIATVVLLALAAAAFAIAWLTRVNQHVLELGRRVLESEDIGRINDAANKIETFQSRMAACEHKASESQKELAEFKIKLNELTAKLGTVEQTAKQNEACVTELIPNVKALADEVQTIKKFQTATEKVHSLIQAALTDMQAGMSFNEGLKTTLQAAKPKEASEGPEEWWQAGDDKNATNK